MTVSIKVLIPAKQAENAQTTQYTATNCKAIIDKFTATNTTATNKDLEKGPEPVLCHHCGRTASNGISCEGYCVADSNY